MAKEKTKAKKPTTKKSTTKRSYAAALRSFSERLDRVAWGQLEHAYGKADDVPALLKALAVGDTEDQGEILSELYSNVLHQGTVYGVTPHAVPFVIELLDIGKGWRLRAELLEYLGHLARGTSTDPVVQRKTQRAVARGIGSYSRFLDGGRTEVRRAAVFVLGGLVAARPPVVRILWRTLSTSRNVGVRACVALALGGVPKLRNQNTKVLAGALTDAPLVRITAALSLVSLLGAASPASAVGYVALGFSWTPDWGVGPGRDHRPRGVS